MWAKPFLIRQISLTDHTSIILPSRVPPTNIIVLLSLSFIVNTDITSKTYMPHPRVWLRFPSLACLVFVGLPPSSSFLSLTRIQKFRKIQRQGYFLCAAEGNYYQLQIMHRKTSQNKEETKYKNKDKPDITPLINHFVFLNIRHVQHKLFPK